MFFFFAFKFTIWMCMVDGYDVCQLNKEWKNTWWSLAVEVRSIFTYENVHCHDFKWGEIQLKLHLRWVVAIVQLGGRGQFVK